MPPLSFSRPFHKSLYPIRSQLFKKGGGIFPYPLPCSPLLYGLISESIRV